MKFTYTIWFVRTSLYLKLFAVHWIAVTCDRSKLVYVLEETEGITEDEFYDLYWYDIILFNKPRGVMVDTDTAHIRKVGGRTNLGEETTLWK